MTFKKLMDLYDNWNGVTVVNDNNLNIIVKDRTGEIMFPNEDESKEDKDFRKKLFAMKVVSFGFYDGEFCVRVK